MRITVFGANGKVGRRVVAEALKRDHMVVAFVHKSSDLPQNDKLTIAKGDVYDAESVTKAVKDSDAVICALGSWGTPGKDIVKSGIKHIIPAMQANRISRIVSLTGHGANAPGDKRDWLHDFSRLILVALAPKILHDGEDHIVQLSKTNLDWTAIRSPIMTGFGNTLNTRIVSKRPLPLALISRQAVAVAMIDLVESKEYIKQAPFLVRK